MASTGARAGRGLLEAPRREQRRAGGWWRCRRGGEPSAGRGRALWRGTDVLTWSLALLPGRKLTAGTGVAHEHSRRERCSSSGQPAFSLSAPVLNCRKLTEHTRLRGMPCASTGAVAVGARAHAAAAGRRAGAEPGSGADGGEPAAA
eukprot:3314746-Rhodomonas_salina.2